MMVIILSLCLTLIYLVTTQGGLALTIAFVTKITDGALHVDNAKGSLIHHFEISNLTFKNNAHNIQIKHAEITWWPLALLTDRIYVRKALLQNISIETISTKTISRPSKKPFVFNLPFAISAHSIHLDNLQLTQNSQQYDLQSANIDFYTLRSKAYIKKADLNFNLHHFDINGTINLASPFDTDIQGKIITELNSDKPINTALIIKGDLKTAYHFSLVTKDPFTLNIMGEILHPLNKGSLNIHGQWNNVIFPVTSSNKIASRSGNISINGHLNHYQIDLNSDFSGTNIPKGNLIIKGSGSLKQVDIQKFNATILNGEINGNLKLTWTPTLFLASNINLNVGSTHLTINGGVNQLWNLKWSLHSSSLSDIFKGFDGAISSDGTITGNLKTPIITSNFHLANFIFSENNLGSADGSIYSDLHFTNTSEHPGIEGSIKLINANATINELGTTFNRINLTASAHQSNTLNLSGSLHSGSSQLMITGQADASEFKFPFSLNLKGENFLAYNKQGYQFYISPDLYLHYAQPEMRLSGTIDIPKASIAPKDYSSAVTLSNDVIIIKNKESAKQSTLAFSLDLHLNLGDDVTISSSGLNAKLGGNLQIYFSPQQLTTAKGQLNILKGSYKVFGTTLKIYKGSLIYTGGPIDNPGLNVSAVKFIQNIVTTSPPASTGGSTQTTTGSFDNIMVGIDITGNLKQPKLTLFSDPSGMHQSDILSYLLFGVPSGQASGSQAQLLIAAAESTNLGGNVTNTLKQTFGLSDIGFESDNIVDSNSGEMRQNTSFVLGKYLTPKLYASYSVGLIVPINIFTLRYFLSKHWLLQTDASSIDNGSDIFYTIQTN